MAAGFEDWYELTGELAQGTILTGFPFMSIDPDSPVEAPVVKRRDANFVVLTQTCDIPKRAQTTLLLAEIESYDRIYASGGHAASKDARKSLAQGTAIASFLIPPNDTVGISWGVVNFRSLFVAPKAQCEKHKPNLALRSPYREHLAQGYARFTMRVGLPSPLHAFEQYAPVA